MPAPVLVRDWRQVEAVLQAARASGQAPVLVTPEDAASTYGAGYLGALEQRQALLALLTQVADECRPVVEVAAAVEFERDRRLRAGSVEVRHRSTGGHRLAAPDVRRLPVLCAR